MQNIPVPSQAAILNNTAASATAAKAAKSSSTANEGPAFKDVLAKQVQAEVKQVGSSEHAMQKQRMLLQLKLGAESQPVVDPELLPAELIVDPKLVQEEVLPVADTDKELLPAQDAALIMQEPVPVATDPQPIAAAVTPDVQRRPAVEVAEELEQLGAQRAPLEWQGKDKPAADVELDVDKTAMSTATSIAKTPANDEQSTLFADALEQMQQQAQVTVAAPLQQPQQAHQAAAAMDVRGNLVPTPFGQPGWNQAIGQKVVWMAAGGEQTASLTLNPPDLGPLQVVIHVHNNQADTTFLSDQADVRRALEDGMDNLRQMMSESGLQLGQANVRSGQQEAQQQATGMNRANAGAQGNEAETVLAKAAKVMGLVDTFA